MAWGSKGAFIRLPKKGDDGMYFDYDTGKFVTIANASLYGKHLTNITHAYVAEQERMVADRLFPTVPVIREPVTYKLDEWKSPYVSLRTRLRRKYCRHAARHLAFDDFGGLFCERCSTFIDTPPEMESQ